MMRDITGQRFGRLVALSVDKFPRTSKNLHWLCQCDCGIVVVVNGGNLRPRQTVSCGCLRKNRFKTHGQHNSKTYGIWEEMIQRCTNSKNRAYKWYGNRGILVCERWRKFENFLEDMGFCPTGYSIERVNNDGNYEPENCKWIPRNEQQRNQRRPAKSTEGPTTNIV